MLLTNGLTLCNHSQIEQRQLKHFTAVTRTMPEIKEFDD